jgi:hypothetical protein
MASRNLESTKRSGAQSPGSVSPPAGDAPRSGPRPTPVSSSARPWWRPFACARHLGADVRRTRKPVLAPSAIRSTCRYPVVMMQATEHRDGDHGTASGGRLSLP